MLNLLSKSIVNFFRASFNVSHVFNAANPQPANNATMGHSPNLLGGTTSPGPGGLQPSLQGVKVPDENLTPKQRQHREVQLATLRKMQMILFPGHKEDQSGNALTDTTQGTAVSCPPTNVPPVGVPNQCSPSMDWHKLQHQFLDGKNKVWLFLFVSLIECFG